MEWSAGFLWEGFPLTDSGAGGQAHPHPLSPWRLSSLPLSHTHTHTQTFLFTLPAKWWNPATARCVCKSLCVCVCVCCPRWPPYSTGGEHTLKQEHSVMRGTKREDNGKEREVRKRGKECQELKGGRRQKKSEMHLCGAVIVKATLWDCSSFEVEASERLTSLHPLPQQPACQLSVSQIVKSKRDNALIRSLLKPNLHWSPELQLLLCHHHVSMKS